MAAGPGDYICFGLPRMISPAIQCSFCTYFFEMYTGEFGWTHAEYGKVPTIYSVIQILSFLGLGFIFKEAITDKDGAKWVEVGGTLIHSATYLLLIILPIKWHGVKTPYVDSLFGKASNFRQAMFGGPVPLSSMATSRGWYRFFCIPWCFVKFFWVILYIPMKVCFFCGGHCMKLLRIIRSHKRNLTRIPPLLETLQAIPPPTCPACCNTTCCNNFAMRMRHAKQFMGTRTFLLYMITFVHGIGMSMHELSSKALETYAFSGTEGAIAVPVSLTFFFGSNLLIYILFTLVKLYVRSRAFFADTFYLLSIIFFVLQIPSLLGFHFGLNSSNSSPPGNPTGGGGPAGYIPHWVMLGALTTFHSTVVFLIFSSGPLVKYVAENILGGHKVLMNFGTLILFGSLLITSFINTGSGVINDEVGLGKSNAANKVFSNIDAHKAIVGVCVVGQSSTFLVPYAHDWSWNKNNWFNYLMLVLTGIVNSIFVAYTNIMLVKLAASKWVKNLQWYHFGIFYSVTNIVIFFFMPTMFSAFGHDEPWINIAWKSIRISVHYSFPTVYRTLTGICILANAIALGLILHYYNTTKLATS